MATEAERLFITLEARMDKYTRDLAQGQAVTNAKLNAIERRFATFSAKIKTETSAAAMSLGGLFAGLGGAMVGQHLVEYASEWTRLTRSIDAGQQTFGVALSNMSHLTDIANEARVDVGAYTALFIRTAAAIRDYGLGADTAATMTSTLAKALKLGGASASEQASVLLQFSQALQKGKLDGDEFRSVMENAGVVQELLAEKLKVSKGEIIKMASEGKLQIGTLIAAMTEGADKVDRIFRGMPSTIDEAFTVLRNNVTRYIGQVDQASGASQSLVNILGAMSRHIDQVASAAATLGAALLASMGRGLLSSIGAIAARLASFPALLAGGAVAAVTFGSEVKFNLDLMNASLAQGNDLAASFRAGMSETGGVTTTLSDQFRGLVSVIGQDLMSAFDGLSKAMAGHAVDWDKVRAAAVLGVGSINAFVQTTVALVVGSISAIPPALTLAYQSAYNAIAGTMQAIVDATAEGINKVIALANKIPGVNMNFMTAPEFGKYDTNGAKKQLSDIRDWMRQTTTEAADLSGMMARVQKEADKIAIDRSANTEWKPVSPFTPKRGSPPVTTDPAAERARNKFEKDLKQHESKLRMMQAEQAAIGLSTYETEKLRVQTELLNAAREAGIKLGPDDIKRIAEMSEAMARVTSETEKAREAYQMIRDESRAFFSDMAKGLRDGKSATDILHDGLMRLSDKLIDMAMNDLVDQALGGLLGKGGGGGISGILSSLVGGFGGAPAATTTGWATSVLPAFANGGITSGPSLAGEAGPEAVVPLSAGRRIPVDLRMPYVPNAVPSANGGAANGKIMVEVAAGPELLVTIRNEAAGVVAKSAPGIVRSSVQETQKNLKPMLQSTQTRKG